MPKVVKENEYLAYNGPKKRIEFYYTGAGRVLGVEFIMSLPDEEKARLAALFAVMGDRGAIWNEEKFKHLDDKIYEFKAHHNRMLCFFFKDDLVIITHGFVKKRQKTPRKEIETAKAIQKDYVERSRRGSYYAG